MPSLERPRCRCPPVRAVVVVHEVGEDLKANLNRAMGHNLALNAFDVGGLGDGVGRFGAVQLRLAAVRTFAWTRCRVRVRPGRVGADLSSQ